MSDAFEAYGKFLALQRHFESDYDWFKYNGKVTLNYEKFLMRKDKYLFFKLANVEDLEGLVISNYLTNDKLWVTDLLDAKAKEVHRDWSKRTQAMMYNFKEEIDRIKTPIEELVKVPDGQFPGIVKLYKQGEISIETLVIFTYAVGMLDVWKKKVQDVTIWPDIVRKIEKYVGFMPKYDATKARKIVVEKFKNG
jgi:hypothetical protein